MTLDFTSAMNTMCHLCEKPAKLHRLDSRNNLFCLALGYEGRRKRNTMEELGHMWDDRMVYTLPTEFLRMSDMLVEVGQAINNTLNPE